VAHPPLLTTVQVAQTLRPPVEKNPGLQAVQEGDVAFHPNAAIHEVHAAD